MKLSHTVFCACLLLPLSLWGKESPQYSIDFTVLPWQGMKPPKGIFYETDGAVVELRFQQVRRSPVYSYQGPSPLVFFRQEINEDGEIVSVAVAQVDLTKGSGRSLLLFAMRPGNADTGPDIGVVVLDDSPEFFKAGSYYLFNLCKEELYCKVGENMHALAPRESWMVRPESDKKSVDAVVMIHGEKGTEQIYRAQWPMKLNQRVLVFFYPSSNNGNAAVDTFVIADYVLLVD